LRTTNTIVEVYGVLLLGSRDCQFFGQQLRLIRDHIDVVGEAERDHIGLEAIDDRTRLRARSTIALADGYGFAGGLLPMFCEDIVKLVVEFASRII
jgi:hypothetical protein